MEKVTLKIQGMSCGMCEAHISDTIRKALPQAKKVAASHTRGEATFLIDGPWDRAYLRRAIDATGYTFVSADTEQAAEKKHFWQK